MTELTGHVRSIRRQLDVIARDSAELSVLINDQFDSMRVLLDDIRKEIREAISERENAR